MRILTFGATSSSALCVVITGRAGYWLTDRVGKEFSVFKQAVRTYRPGFNPDVDEPFHHSRALTERIAGWADGGAEAYRRFLVTQTLLRSTAIRDADKQLPPPSPRYGAFRPNSICVRRVKQYPLTPSY